MGIEQRSFISILAAWVVVLLVTPAPFLGAQDRESGQDEPDKASSEDPRPSVSEYVFVEDSLPYVPTANTIVSKLPLELRLTPNNVGIVTKPRVTSG